MLLLGSFLSDTHQDVVYSHHRSFVLDRCCERVVVKASGNAKQDQSLYLGTYIKISNYNGHHAYEREGKERLYIYFYSSLVIVKMF